MALKKRMGNNLSDVIKERFKESGINQGVIYEGIYGEDSTRLYVRSGA
jgi:hypothetical protein